MWLSLKPGKTSFPPASITRVFLPINGFVSVSVPTAIILFCQTAIDCALGVLSSMVRTFALIITKSAIIFCWAFIEKDKITHRRKAKTYFFINFRRIIKQTFIYLYS